MIYNYVMIFAELIAAPFRSVPTLFGIVPLYFGLVVNEITSAKANFKTAVQTGFSFLWAGMQWLYPHFKSSDSAREALGDMLPINLLVTGVTLLLGALALFSGVRRRYPEKCQFLGHSRFGESTAPPLTELDLTGLAQPVLVVHHEQDPCGVCPPAQLPELMKRLPASAVLKTYSGGQSRGGPCDPWSHHGFNGIEDRVVADIAGWIQERK